LLGGRVVRGRSARVEVLLCLVVRDHNHVIISALSEECGDIDD
jgi:hypothetical protein